MSASSTNSTKLRSAAAEEALRRRALLADLVQWAKHYGQEKGWSPAKHHMLLLEKLQAVTDGTLRHSKTGNLCRNLMILMPPGAAKSSYTSIIFPIWFMQRWPTIHPEIGSQSRILACSYATNLIESFSRECRNGVEMHEKYLGFGLCKDSRSVEEWSCTNGATYRCGGVGGGIAGRRADAGVIDDYLGTQEDADSKLVRDKQWDWYWGDFWPRLKPNAIQIIIANRRHEDDLVGRLIEKQEDKWEIIKIPFFAKENDVLGRLPGERLWPEWFTEEQADSVKQLPARMQAGLYGQEPAPEDGNYFKAEMLQTYNQTQYDELMKKSPRIFGAGDWAVSEEKDANRQCFGGAAMDEDGVLYILPDIFWKAAGPKEVLVNFLDFLRRRNPLQFWSEKGHISKAWGPFFKEAMVDADICNYITEVTPAKNKEVRAQAIRGRMSMLRVKFPAFASWWPAAMHEMLTFPGGKADDFVDFLAHLGMGINNILRAKALPKPDVDKLDCPTITLRWIKDSAKARQRALAPRYQGR